MENCLSKIYKHALIHADELHQIQLVHEKINVKKNQPLLLEGQVANSYSVIETGVVRFYVHDYLGNEITTQFCCSGEIVNEVSSLFLQKPSQQNIQAVTDCNLWTISFDDFQSLYHNLESVREWGREWMSMRLFESSQRATDMIILSAIDRYKQLLAERPEIIKYAPLKQIASFLGVTDSSLSRIRSELYS